LTASINIDASPCSTTSGLFSLGLIRLAESAPDFAFVEPFIWRLGQKKVVVELWANEAVHKYWVEEVATCPCHSNRRCPQHGRSPAARVMKFSPAWPRNNALRAE
jgi:hypothetical protein